MSLTTIQAEDLAGYQFGGTFATLVFRATKTFYTPEGTHVVAGDWLKKVVCAVEGTVLKVPAVELSATTDSSEPTARYSVVLLDSKGNPREFLINSEFKLSHTLGDSITWHHLRTSNTARTAQLPPEYLSAERSQQLFLLKERLFEKLFEILQPGANVSIDVDEEDGTLTLNAIGGGGGGGISSVNGKTTSTINLTTDDIPQGATNRYASAAVILGTVLTGVSFALNAAITAADPLLVAVGKLQAQISDRVVKNNPITPGTKTKLTFDAKGLVTGGTDATTADIDDSLNKRYVTDAEKTKLGDLSGTNSGDQDLSGFAQLSGAAFTGPVTVQNTTYGPLWNGSFKPATENAVFDKIESLELGGEGVAGSFPFTNDDGTESNIPLDPDGGGTGGGSGGASELGALDDVKDSVTPIARHVLIGDGALFESRALQEADLPSHSHAASSITGFTAAAQIAAPPETASTVGVLLHGATAKAAPVDADTFPIINSQSSNTLFKLTFAALKTWLKTYFDSLYQSVLESGTNIKTINGNSILGSGNLTISGGGGGTSALDDLTDVTAGAPAENDILQRKSGAWVNRTIAQLITDLSLAAANISDFAATVRGTVLTGFSTALNTAVIATDTFLVAVGKLQAQINGKANSTHSHAIADTTGLQDALDAKAAGTHTHSIANVTNLQNALDGKVAGNVAITAGTKTKLTYDTKGLITGGADATTADISDSTNKRYVTDAEKTKLGNLSNTNTGDQTITLTGDVAGSGTGSFAATIQANSVNTSKMADNAVTPAKEAAIVALTDGANVAIDAGAGKAFKHSGSTGRTFLIPSNLRDGKSYTLRMKNTGGVSITHTLTVAGDDCFEFHSDLGVTALSATPAGKTDLIAFYYDFDAKRCYVVAYRKGV